MIDDARLTDADLAAKVAALDPELAKIVRARLRSLRLRCVVAPLAPPREMPGRLEERGQPQPSH